MTYYLSYGPLFRVFTVTPTGVTVATKRDRYTVDAQTVTLDTARGLWRWLVSLGFRPW